MQTELNDDRPVTSLFQIPTKDVRLAYILTSSTDWKETDDRIVNRDLLLLWFPDSRLMAYH